MIWRVIDVKVFFKVESSNKAAAFQPPQGINTVVVLSVYALIRKRVSALLYNIFYIIRYLIG